MRVVVISLLLLIPVASAAPFTGHERMVSDGPVELTQAAVGDGFVAWSDSRRGVSDIYIRPVGEEVFRLTLSDANRETNFHPAADGRWIAWIRNSEATPDPTTEQPGAWSREYVVYDTVRQAKVFESGNPGREADRLVVAGDRLGFLNSTQNEPTVFMITEMTGPNAFVEEKLLDGGPHAQPTLSPSHAAFMDHDGNGWRIVAVDLATREVQVVADEPGVGYLRPTLDGTRLAWIEYRDGEPSVRIKDLAGDEDRHVEFPVREVHRLSLRDDLLVVEARNETRFLMSMCLDEGTQLKHHGHNPVRSFPVLTDWHSVVYSAPQQGRPYLWEMPISCEPLATDGNAPGQESSGLGWLAVATCLAIASRRVPLHIGRRVRR